MQIANSDRITASSRSLLLTMIFTIAGMTTTFAQLLQVPLERGAVSKSPVRKSSSNARTQVALTLPFFEDFSTTEGYNPLIDGSGYPDQDLWFDSNSVWIADDIGRNNPSLNVATFDGLDSLGKPLFAPHIDVKRWICFRESTGMMPGTIGIVMPSARHFSTKR